MARDGALERVPRTGSLQIPRLRTSMGSLDSPLPPIPTLQFPRSLSLFSLFLLSPLLPLPPVVGSSRHPERSPGVDAMVVSAGQSGYRTRYRGEEATDAITRHPGATQRACLCGVGRHRACWTWHGRAQVQPASRACARVVRGWGGLAREGVCVCVMCGVPVIPKNELRLSSLSEPGRLPT